LIAEYEWMIWGFWDWGERRMPVKWSFQLRLILGPWAVGGVAHGRNRKAGSPERAKADINALVLRGNAKISENLEECLFGHQIDGIGCQATTISSLLRNVKRLSKPGRLSPTHEC
jgi:hypothetical protein